MTKKDFFRILIKIFGLYSVIVTLFELLPRIVQWIMYERELLIILLILLVTAFIILLYVLLLKKPDVLIRILSLDKGFDEEHIQFDKLNAESIIKLAALIIGGFLIIDNVPSFLSQCYFAFKNTANGGELVPKEKLYWATTFFNIVMGYILVTNYEWVSRLLNEKKDNMDQV